MYRTLNCSTFLIFLHISVVWPRWSLHELCFSNTHNTPPQAFSNCPSLTWEIICIDRLVPSRFSRFLSGAQCIKGRAKEKREAYFFSLSFPSTSSSVAKKRVTSGYEPLYKVSLNLLQVDWTIMASSCTLFMWYWLLHLLWEQLNHVGYTIVSRVYY